MPQRHGCDQTAQRVRCTCICAVPSNNAACSTWPPCCLSSAPVAGSARAQPASLSAVSHRCSGMQRLLQKLWNLLAGWLAGWRAARQLHVSCTQLTDQP